MAKYINLNSATDEDIVAYLLDYWHIDSFKFEGDFNPSKSVESSVSGAFSNIQSATSKRLISFYPPMIKGLKDVVFFVPKNMPLIQGHYTFECELATNTIRRVKNNSFLLKLKLRSIKPSFVNNYHTRDESLVKKNLKLKDNLFVGRFHRNPDGQYAISDIRRTDFSKLILQDGEQIHDLLFMPNAIIIPEDNAYYEFSWILKSVKHEEHKYNFTINQQKPIIKVTPKNVIDRLHKAIIDSPAGSGDRDVKMIETLKSQLTASGKEIFIYELLQNANDYPQKAGNNIIPVDVEFHIMNEFLIFMHSGAEFNERNIAAICNINDKEKSNNPNAIGYKGIGFKTVFVVSNYVYLSTGPYHFRFDEAFTKDMVATPYQLLPIWTNPNTLGHEVVDLFNSTKEQYNVQFAIKPTTKEALRESSQNFVKLFSEVFKNERVILFIPNIKSVKIFFHDDPRTDIIRNRDSEKWVVNSYVEPISEDLRSSINDEIDNQAKNGTMKIPTKYWNFMKTKVSFACAREGAILKKVENSILYCYLPAKDASWGMDFLLNTDMVPTGPRNDIECDLEINKEIANIAGKKFFDWIFELCESKSYKIDSIFSLIPNFEFCKVGRPIGHQNLITKFQSGFETRLLSEAFIPTSNDSYSVISEVINDETKLSSAGIMTDKDFCRFIGMNYCQLPLPLLRRNLKFKSFLNRYANSNLKFSKKDFPNLIANEDFQKWLKVQENDNNFLKFLLDNDYLEDLLDEKIFLEEKGSLQTASALHYDIDEYLEDLQSFTSHINFLSRKTREYFKDDEKWGKVIDGRFARFLPKDFVDNNLLSRQNLQETIEKLNDKNTSIHFFKFLAENVEFSKAYKDLPYIDDENNVVDSFNSDFIFVENEEGKLQTKAKWLEGIPFSFISADYGEDVLSYFKNTSIEGSDVSTPTFGVLDYDKSVIIEDVILNEKYAEKVNANQQKNEDVHKSFISFCYANKNAFNAGSLKQYAIKVNEKNKDGETRHELTEDNIFFETLLYDTALEHPWIGTDWMFCLSKDLLSAEISTDTEQLKKFYEDKFGVKDLTAQLFYDEIVSKNINAIFKATSKPTTENVDKETALSAIAIAKKCNFDFVSYLNDNIDLVYKDNDFAKFNRLALLDNNEEFIENDSVTFFYDETLSNFMSKVWLSSNIVNMCSETYRHSLALERMQVKQNPRIKYYDFATLYNLVIVPNLIVINQYLDDKAVNLDFHNSIIANIGAITPDDRKKISNAKVFIRGKKMPVLPASGHKIVSKTVEELVELSLVDYSELDLLEQDYHANEHSDYWREALGNDFFTIKDFQDWLINNKESVATKLQDKILNIKFWRWAKKNVKENLSYLSKLPILLKGKDVPCVLSGEIYFSDEYLDSPIESLVNAIAPNAPILTSDYIDFGEEKKDWVDFWTQLGVRQNEVEVLENVIRTRLSVTKVPNLAELIYKNRALLEPRFNNNLIGNLADIQLAGTDNQYRVAKDCVFVSISNDELNDEPFAYISIPNLVTSSQAGVNSFIGEIIQKYNSAHYITDLNKWRQEKIWAYLALQNENEQAEVHMSLIKDLAVLINANKENLSALSKVGDIHLLDRDNTYKSCTNLTEGSKYHPFFDFEICGITLDYISDSYLSCGVSVMKLFNYMKVHHNLEENDLPKLSDYATACYFWEEYLGIKAKDRRGKNIKHVESFITNSKNPFKELVCVPTLGGTVVKAENLYSLRIKDKVALLTDGEMLLPLDIIAEGVIVDENSANKEGEYFMDKLPFKEMLSVGHCFEALCNISSGIKPSKEKELRKELVKWIVCQKDEISTNLAEYRANENALWYNGITQKQQVSKLYALDPKDNLEQYFGNNAKIIDASYIANKDNQLDAFAALGIKVISQKDVATVPSADKKLAYNSNSIKNDLKFYTLIISGIESPESWKNSYEEYCCKIDKMSFWTCSAIEKKYKGDGDVVKRLSGFYHEDGKDDFYYKYNLDSKLVFLDYVNGVKKYLEIKADIEIVKKVMDSKQTACDLIVAEYGRLLSDEEFVEEVRKTFPKFNHKDVIESTTPPTIPEPVTDSVNLTGTESVNPPKVVEKQKEQEVNNEDSEKTVHLSKADTNTLSQSEQIEAQLEAQKYLFSVKPMWKFPYNFAEVDEEGIPYCFSTFEITDEKGNDWPIVLKSYKRDDAPFSINPGEWDSIMNHKAKILIYRGNDIVEIEKEDLVKNQNSIILRFSTENLDVEDRISQFSNLLHYFKQIHFDFESFNVSKRAKSIIGITNKNQGIQIGNSDEDL